MKYEIKVGDISEGFKVGSIDSDFAFGIIDVDFRFFQPTPISRPLPVRFDSTLYRFDETVWTFDSSFPVVRFDSTVYRFDSTDWFFDGDEIGLFSLDFSNPNNSGYYILGYT